MTGTVWQMILLVFAFCCFALAAFNVGHPRCNLQSLGLAFATLAFILR